MTPREIIAEAWSITTRERSLRRWGFTAALFETLLDVKLLIYQVYFLISYLQGDPIGFFKIEELLFSNLPFWGFLTFIITLIVLFTVEIFLPKMCLGAIIGLAAKAHKKEDVKGGLVLALYNFFPIFAIRELFVLGSTTTMITVISLILRYMGEGFRGMLISLTIFIWVLSNLFRFFANFAEEEAVIRKSGVFRSIGRSFKLIVSHLRHVVFLLMLLFIISLRILLNALLPSEPVWLEQVHSTLVADAGQASCLPQADACITRHRAAVCVVMTADCLPVLLCDEAGSVVGAVHAGWKGLAAGVIEAAVLTMNVAPQSLMAWLGPAISQEAFEVGEEVRAAFVAVQPQAASAFTPGRPGKWFADIYALARLRLDTLGITQIYGGNHCTYREHKQFFSYRRDGATGRMGTFIWLS